MILQHQYSHFEKVKRDLLKAGVELNKMKMFSKHTTVDLSEDESSEQENADSQAVRCIHSGLRTS